VNLTKASKSQGKVTAVNGSQAEFPRYFNTTCVKSQLLWYIT